ncbi:MAG: activase [Desulfobacteraceae bacterium]|nr:activase [Desulfobacteraceae bacterium]
MRTAGICMGASTISIVVIEQDMDGTTSRKENGPRVIYSSLHPHEGDPKRTLVSVLEHLDIQSLDRIAVTGRQFRRYVNLTSIPEPEAVEYAYGFSKPLDISCPAVVSAGGETFMAYVLDRSGRISNVLTGNKCASGTGEFFLQQLRRMDVSLEEAALWAATEDPHHVSGRCSVFCKSDCTHATNEGIPKPKVSAGLCRMMANKIIELLKKVERRNIMLVGGTSVNRMMVEYLGKQIPGLVIPEYAASFEALGAALWALENQTLPFPGFENLFRKEAGTFDILRPLAESMDRVEFKTMTEGTPGPGEIYVLGLDVGSTTTKAVLLRTSDNAVTAKVYLRTNGDPVGASRQCYRAVLDQVEKRVDPDKITIIGLGVCGSGRQIAGLHALTSGVVNEIIAHATAAVHFDPKVDTLFEIGGQDAKYTYITNGVASDYAMNEACSAGTGSFLEESAFESLGLAMEDIADIAIQAEKPPNFNDQCAAFIASDIKNAIHNGVEHGDIVAGLVYSICMNYANRVKGNRPVGKKVFMQGGVCYNRAVPLAMAALVNKPIVVPPEPGLMGAFGAALEIKKRIDIGLMEKANFNLKTLANRGVIHKEPFICKGGREKCDRRCEIARISLEGADKIYTFGGACNRYYNLRNKIKYDISRLDLVRARQYLIFEKYGFHPETEEVKPFRGRIGLNRSYLVNTYFPLYSTFFGELGFMPVLPDTSSMEGIDQRESAFCFPGELSHGFFHTLIHMEPALEYLFLPHFKAVPTSENHSNSLVCPIVQGEPYCLKAAFKDRLATLEKNGTTLLTPVLDMTGGIEKIKAQLVETARMMGCSPRQAKAAFSKAIMRQDQCMAEMKVMGLEAIKALEAQPENRAVVLFARPYSGFVDEAHKGIPYKLASRGVMIIPMDFLPLDKEKGKRNMYWGMGQLILKASRFVKRHPQLFGTYITNFSCGPDSFVLGYFRNIMGRKPSLTLELDNHTADAGLVTRIEAFLDIVDAYRQLETKPGGSAQSSFKLAGLVMDNGQISVRTSAGQKLPLTHPRVTMLLPSMGRLSTEAIAAACRAQNYRVVAHPPSDEEVLKMGRANTSCKECLPLILITGMLLNYLESDRPKDEVLVYFMPTGSGPCRFGQYKVFLEDMLKQSGIQDVALCSLSDDDGYDGFATKFHQHMWWGLLVADVMDDARSMLLTNARNLEKGMEVFNEQWQKILTSLETGSYARFQSQLARAVLELNGIAMKKPVEEVPVISLIGEIFVRRDHLSRRYMATTLAEKGFATTCSPISEWVLYSDWMVSNKYGNNGMTFFDKIKFFLKKRYMQKYEKQIKSQLTQCNLVNVRPITMDVIIENAKPYISPHLAGEAIVTVGAALEEVASKSCGAISIGPFGCMPSRLVETILNVNLTNEKKQATEPDNQILKTVLEDIEDLPFLAIESDGSPFPQVIDAKLESFCLRALRLHEKMLAAEKM